MTGYVGPIEKATLKNTYFRQVLFTGKYSQLVVMCLQPSEEIGNEVHPAVISSSGSRKVLPSSSSMARKNTRPKMVTLWWYPRAPITM